MVLVRTVALTKSGHLGRNFRTKLTSRFRAYSVEKLRLGESRSAENALLFDSDHENLLEATLGGDFLTDFCAKSIVWSFSTE